MNARYYVLTFAMCFFAWVILVDNAIMPGPNNLRQDNGAFTRYRVKEWDKGGKLDILKDELLIYAVVKGREQLYYMEYKPHYEMTLKQIPQLTPVQLRYVRRFPKFWKRHVYDLRLDGRSVISYSAYHLQQKQQEIWKLTGIIGGIYLFLVLLGFLSKFRR